MQALPVFNIMKRLKGFAGRTGPLLLIIMDGVGVGSKDEANAFYLAKTPNLDKFFKQGLYTELKAHGKAVGLPSDKDMGNSEVGHNTMGAGRVFEQGAKLVPQAIDSGELFDSKAWKEFQERATEKGVLHFIGLLSDGNVHSHIEHLLQLIKKAAEDGIKEVCVHPLLDGRDVDGKSALIYIDKLEAFLAQINCSGDYCYRIASGGGRMVTTMDRYFADWSIVKRGWDAHVRGVGRQFNSAREAISTFYEEDPKITDQYLSSFVVAKNGVPVGKIMDGDSVLFFNFRGDRAIEISMAFEDKEFDKFDREEYPDVFYAGMMEYDGDLKIPKNYLVQPPLIENTLSEYFCAEGIPSFAISETQKFGHVTYFWNGNRSGYINEELETYIEIPSDKITFDKAPEMKAREITKKVVELLDSGDYKFGRLNFANGDMVGHTGQLAAAIKACETVDECVGRLVQEVFNLNGIVLITADHGNCDVMYRENNGIKHVVTSHTLNPVPFVILDSGYKEEYKYSQLKEPGLANIAATICNLLGFEAPTGYESSLVKGAIPKIAMLR
jgi:2,3-bisphosphoglycerate-independent phosphoglycerate mutase